MEWINDPTAVAVTGNLLDIGRSFYMSRRKEGYPVPDTAAAMVELHFRAMSAASCQVLEDYGLERYFDTAHLAFQNLVEDTILGSVAGLVDGFDQFYWEHRMGAWHGPAMAERDFYAEPFIPFNSRNIFEAMLGIPREHRDSGEVFYRMINMVDPELLEFPINPKSWPQTTNV